MSNSQFSEIFVTASLKVVPQQIIVQRYLKWGKPSSDQETGLEKAWGALLCCSLHSHRPTDWKGKGGKRGSSWAVIPRHPPPSQGHPGLGKVQGPLPTAPLHLGTRKSRAAAAPHAFPRPGSPRSGESTWNRGSCRLDHFYSLFPPRFLVMEMNACSYFKNDCLTSA